MRPEPAPAIATVLEEATERLRAAGVPDARREAGALMAMVLGTDRGGVAVRKSDPLGPDAADRFDALIAERMLRKPMQHLAGHAEFRGLQLEVGPTVLIPRPETEDLVQAVLDAGLGAEARIADLGTGSGCIAIALASERPGWRIEAIDASPQALSVARANAHRHRVDDRITFVEADFAELDAGWAGMFEGVVSNPPYVAEAEWRELAPEVRSHEPKLALVPGPTGHEAYAVIAPVAYRMLAPGGLLALELGWTGESAVRGLVGGAGFHEVTVLPDMQGIPRVLTARRPASS